jgi:hypothetical protein
MMLSRGSDRYSISRHMRFQTIPRNSLKKITLRLRTEALANSFSSDLNMACTHDRLPAASQRHGALRMASGLGSLHSKVALLWATSSFVQIITGHPLSRSPIVASRDWLRESLQARDRQFPASFSSLRGRLGPNTSRACRARLLAKDNGWRLRASSGSKQCLRCGAKRTSVWSVFALCLKSCIASSGG